MNMDLLVLIFGEFGMGKFLIVKEIYDFLDCCILLFIMVMVFDLIDLEGLVCVFVCVKGGIVVFDEVFNFDSEIQVCVVCMMDNSGDYNLWFMVISQVDLMNVVEKGIMC